MNILWIHNFNPKIKNSGVFMHQAYDDIKHRYADKCNITLFYIGNLRNIGEFTRALLDIRKESKKYDILHAQFGSACGLVGAFSNAKYNFVTLRGSDWHYSKIGNIKKILHSFTQGLITRLILFRYDKIITVSHRMANEVSFYVNKEKIYVIPSPVDIKKFYPINRVEARKKLNLDQNKKYFLYSVVDNKKLIKRPWFINALKEHLIDGVEIITVNNIDHDEMNWFYNAVNAILLPSIHEGWPNVVKEAMLCNTPFIATNVGDLKEIALKNKIVLY